MIKGSSIKRFDDRHIDEIDSAWKPKENWMHRA